MTDLYRFTLTQSQHNAVRTAHAFYHRVRAGDLLAIADMVADGTLPLSRDISTPRVVAGPAQVQHVRMLMEWARERIGYRVIDLACVAPVPFPSLDPLEGVTAACRLREALDFFSRIAIGQIEEVASLVRMGEIAQAGVEAGDKRQFPGQEVCDDVAELMDRAKAVLGYPRNGSNGIGHKHVSIDAHRSWEVKKVLARTLAIQRDPNPTSMRGVDYDGLILRCTDDPEPKVEILSG